MYNARKTVKTISKYTRERALCMVSGGMDLTDIAWTSDYRYLMLNGHPMALSAGWR